MSYDAGSYRPAIRRVAMLSVHTSPLDAPGQGDAGGMNVYLAETATCLARLGVEVEVFTRATASDQPPVSELAPGVLVRTVAAGPFETAGALGKNDLPAQLCGFTAGVLRAEARREPGWYDAVHSHYWLAGQVGWLARDRWGVPLIHSAHTLAKVKNAALAEGDAPEPLARVNGEQQVVDESDLLVANTDREAHELVEHYAADPRRVRTVAPGVDLATYSPGDRRAARRELGIPEDALLLTFVGRLQALKAPDLLLRVASLIRDGFGDRLRVAVLGAPSGSGCADPAWLTGLASSLGIADIVRFQPPVGRAQLADWYRASDLTVVPSYNESFGLVALESQACGTPVVAARVGGLPTAVDGGRSGLLVPGHDPLRWAEEVGGLLRDPARRAVMSVAARRHAERFSWARTAEELLVAYQDAAGAFRRALDREGAAL